MRVDRRPFGVLLTLLGAVGIALLVELVPSTQPQSVPIVEAEPSSVTAPIDPEPQQPSRPSGPTTRGTEFSVPSVIDPNEQPTAHARQMRRHEIEVQFNHGVESLRVGATEEAIKSFHRVLELAPQLYVAHLNLGFSFLAREEYAMAQSFFNGAIELSPERPSAYFGLAQSYEGLGELELAMGAMRSYIHLLPPQSKENRIESGQRQDLILARARSALWEWEAKLERGPWGETQGIPWGLTEADVLRDGTGVGMISVQPDGTGIAMESPNK